MESTLSEIISAEVDEDEEKAHRWRLCPIGKHYVREHQEHVLPSKKHPEGEIVIRHAHCASNPLSGSKKTNKDVLSFDELQVIAKTYFLDLPGPPTANILTEYPRADEFDVQIRGWVQYWNDVFQAREVLDPNLIKALIASESGFNPNIINPKNPKKIGPARGLMQLTDETLRILHGHENGLRDNFIYLSHIEAMDPSANICAGTRWLFLKRAGAKERYAKIEPNHKVSWEDAVAEYKGVLAGILDKDNKHPDPEGKMPKFRYLYAKFQDE